MIGNTYWTTGITVRWSEGRGWAASLDFLDDGFTNDDPDRGLVSTEGRLHTRYFVSDGKSMSGLTVAIDTLIADATRLGIQLGGPGNIGPVLYCDESADWPPPSGWREMLSEESERLGWRQMYAADR